MRQFQVVIKIEIDPSGNNKFNKWNTWLIIIAGVKQSDAVSMYCFIGTSRALQYENSF
jgi:hypothetical protein